MSNITFKQQFTFNEEAVKGFAIHLGWQEKLTRQVEIIEEDPVIQKYETQEYDNPQSFTEYVQEKAREHTLLFTKSWAEKLKKDYIDTEISLFKSTLEPSLTEQIIKPVEDALISEIIIN